MSARMILFQSLLDFLTRYMQVNFRGRYVFMAQEQLNTVQVGAIFE